MAFFHQNGMRIQGVQVGLSNATPSVAVFTALADEWTDIYTVHATTNDTASETITVSDGTTTLTYFVGGNVGGNNPPLYDQSSVPVRFKKGAIVTVAANAVTALKGTQVILRFLTGKT